MPGLRPRHAPRCHAPYPHASSLAQTFGSRDIRTETPMGGPPLVPGPLMSLLPNVPGVPIFAPRWGPKRHFRRSERSIAGAYMYDHRVPVLIALRVPRYAETGTKLVLRGTSECRSLIDQCPGERLSLSWVSSWRCTLCSTRTDHRLATASRCKRIAVASYSISAGLPALTS